jgi:hypothetical protein
LKINMSLQNTINAECHFLLLEKLTQIISHDDISNSNYFFNKM